VVAAALTSYYDSNIWNPGGQGGTVDLIGKHYGFSDRLILTIKDWDYMKDHLRKTRRTQTPPKADTESLKLASQDLEKGVVNGKAQATAQETPRKPPTMESMAAFALMQGQMNYTSLDAERKCEINGFLMLYRQELTRGPSCLRWRELAAQQADAKKS
jgi:hypothetical protein